MTKEEIIESELGLITSSEGDPDCWTYDWVSAAKLRAVGCEGPEVPAPPSDPIELVKSRFEGLVGEMNSNPDPDDFFAVNLILEAAGLWLACHYAWSDKNSELSAGADPEEWLMMAERIDIAFNKNIDSMTSSDEARAEILCQLDYIGMIFREARPTFLSDAVFYAATSLPALAEATEEKGER